MPDIIRISLILIAVFVFLVSIKDWWYGDTRSACSGTVIALLAIGGAILVNYAKRPFGAVAVTWWSRPDDAAERCSMSNQISIIKPYRWEGAWVFDDETVGLKREPFVFGADTLIDAALAESGMSEVQSFLLLFSAAPFPGATVTLEWRREEMDGNVYGWAGREGWLCPALLLYFPTAPQRLHVQVKRAG